MFRSKSLFTFTLFYFFTIILHAQIIPEDRWIDWQSAGISAVDFDDYIEVQMTDFEVIGDGITPNDEILSNALSNLNEAGSILIFPEGHFLFTQTINLPSNTVIRGQGAEKTTFSFDLGGGEAEGFEIRGTQVFEDITPIIEFAAKDDQSIFVENPELFSIGDWIHILQTDDDLVTSNWAKNKVGQILKITNIENNKITLSSKLRLDLELFREPKVQRINPKENVGIECLKINRLDETPDEQTSNILFRYAVNSWVSSVESVNCNFSHVQVQLSSNLYITKSYFHHAHDYGSGGKGYGVTLEHSTNECLVENNIFEHLRHSMLLQSGANGNVFAYNFSTDPFWDAFFSPDDAGGDIVLHGNYPFANLFEHNVCRNIVIDNSHGQNGPNNTFFRNRAEGYGIKFTTSNSPNQTLIGNDISNTEIPYSLANYSIQGDGHFIYGNNNKGAIEPAGTADLEDISYAYSERPDFIPTEHWGAIGTPNIMGIGTIPARERFLDGNLFPDGCGSLTAISNKEFDNKFIEIFPNPTHSEFVIKTNNQVSKILIINELGQKLKEFNSVEDSNNISINDLQAGIYFAIIYFDDFEKVAKRLVKID